MDDQTEATHKGSPDNLSLQRSELFDKDRSSTSFFNDAYNVVAEHPWESAAVVLAAGLGVGALSRRFSAMGAERAAAGEFKAGDGVLKTIEGKAIPDLERPFVKPGQLDLNTMSVKAAGTYSSDLSKLWEMPRTATVLEGESLQGFAERSLKERARLTGERLNPDAFSKELERITKLNPDLAADAALSGKSLTISTDESLAKAAEELQFKHVPQIGQFLKGTGKISEEQIEKALEIQRAIPAGAPLKLIGEILVENKLAAQSDVDLAFSNQQELKAALKSVREEFMSSIKKLDFSISAPPALSGWPFLSLDAIVARSLDGEGSCCQFRIYPLA